MLNPRRVDAVVDLGYGALILLAIALIATVEFGVGIAFGVGVFSAYVLHVVWKMARFDPDWMTAVVEDAVDDSVERALDDTLEDSVEQQLDDTIGDQLDTVQAHVEAVDQRISESDDDPPTRRDGAEESTES